MADLNPITVSIQYGLLVDAVALLTEFSVLREYKKHNGKTSWYHREQSKLWERMRAYLKLVGEAVPSSPGEEKIKHESLSMLYHELDCVVGELEAGLKVTPERLHTLRRVRTDLAKRIENG